MGPGKFDVFSVGMMGVRTLIPAFQSGGVTTQWPGGRFQLFAEEEFPKTGYDFQKYLVLKGNDGSEPLLAAQCKELLESPDMKEIRVLLQTILVKNIITRPGAQDALRRVGGSFAAQAQEEQRDVKNAEAEAKRQAAETSKTGQEQERQEEQSTKQADKEEEGRLKLGAELALGAAQNFIKSQKQIRGSSEVKKLFGASGDDGKSGVSERSDKDIANIVPDEWKEGSDFYRSPKLAFTPGEIVVTFRSDKSRRFGKIIQDYGEGTYDILVDKSGGQGEGQYRTERVQSIGKIATGRSLKEEEAASQDSFRRQQKKNRKLFVDKKARLGERIPQEWQMNVDLVFGPTSFFKVGSDWRERESGLLVRAYAREEGEREGGGLCVCACLVRGARGALRQQMRRNGGQASQGAGGEFGELPA